MEEERENQGHEEFEERSKFLWASIRERVESASEKGKGVRLSAEETLLVFLMFDYPGD